jgi:hypothetical protein
MSTCSSYTPLKETAGPSSYSNLYNESRSFAPKATTRDLIVLGITPCLNVITPSLRSSLSQHLRPVPSKLDLRLEYQ